MVGHSGVSAVYHSACERTDFCIRFDTLRHSCNISTRQWKVYTYVLKHNIFILIMTRPTPRIFHFKMVYYAVPSSPTF